MKYGLYGGLFLLLVFAIVSTARGIVFQYKLFKYLRKEHTEKWKELTTMLGFGPGYHNSVRGIKFLFSKDDLGDPEVLRLKVIARNSFLYVITGFSAVFIMFCIIVTVGN